MKRLLLILGAVMLVLGGLMAPAFAEEEGVVDVTVEPTQASVTVSPSTVSYGIVQIGSTGVVPEGDPSIFARNSGSGWVDFLIRGADTTNWTLGDTPGPDVYVHYFGWPVGPTPTYTPLTYANQELSPHVSYAPGSGEPFKLMMDTPTSSASYELQATTVTVLAIMVEKGISATLVTDEPSYTQGTLTATLTVTVLDENDQPLTGLTSDNLKPRLKLAGELSYPVTVNFEETKLGVSGIYVGLLDISGLAQGSYNVSVKVIDTLSRAAQGNADFEITTPP